MSFRDQLTLRPVAEPDRARLRDWRNQDFIRSASLTDHVIGDGEHNDWFDRVLIRDDGLWCVAELDGLPVGHVKAVARGDGAWQWSFYVGDPTAPKGTGAAMLALFLAQLFARDDVACVTAQSLAANAASCHLHQKLGFERVGAPDAAVLNLSLSRARWQDAGAVYDTCLNRAVERE